MATVIVRYKVEPGRGDENTDLVKAVFAELKETKPNGVRYATFVADDGLSFTHVASVDEGVENPIPQLDAFKVFQQGLRERCEEKPTPTPVREVGSYNFFD